MTVPLTVDWALPYKFKIVLNASKEMPKDQFDTSNSSIGVLYSQMTLVYVKFMEVYQYIAQGHTAIQSGKSSTVNLNPKSVFQTIFKGNNKKANNSSQKINCLEFPIK